MVMTVVRLLCLFLPHQWRRAHNGEAPGYRYCRRCPATKPVKARRRPLSPERIL